MRRTSRFVMLALLVAASAATVVSVRAIPQGAAQAPASQQAPPVFRATADFVEVDAVVVDAKDRFVPNLTKGDFTLLEDGKPQDIATFEFVNIARPPAAAAKASPGTLPKAAAASGSAPIPPSPAAAADARSRLYFLVFDDLHIMPEMTSRSRKLAHDFVAKHLSPNDRVSVLFTSGRQDTSQEITTDRALLDKAIDRMVGHKLDSSTMMAYGGGIAPAQRGTDRPAASDAQSPRSSERPGDSERYNEVRSAIDTLSRIADWVTSLRGERKLMVFISDGFDFDIANVEGTGRDVRGLLTGFTNTSNRANLSLYAIDPRGATQGGEFAAQLTATGASQTMLQDEMRASHESLRTIAFGTGGEAFVGTSNFDRAFDRIVAANSTYYLLSYQSTSPADGKFHTIELRTTRPGLTVRGRPGFVKTAVTR